MTNSIGHSEQQQRALARIVIGFGGEDRNANDKIGFVGDVTDNSAGDRRSRRKLGVVLYSVKCLATGATDAEYQAFAR